MAGLRYYLLGVAASQEEVGNWCLLVGTEGVKSWRLSVQALLDLDDAVPRHSEVTSRREQFPYLGTTSQILIGIALKLYRAP